MNASLPRLLAAALLAATGPLAAGPGGSPVVREERTVVVGGVVETWRFEWRKAPVAACPPEGEEWSTCPCAGFEFGEAGELDLVRVRQGAPDERLPLAPFFADGEAPGPGAVLRRWPARKGDDEASRKAGFAAAVRARPPLPVMEVADYDHDGAATEFILQVSAGPCSHRPSILVGLDRASRKLHALGTAEEPGEPLLLERASDWEKVRAARGPVVLPQWPCGDHGTEEEETVTVRTDAKGLHATRTTKRCP